MGIPSEWLALGKSLHLQFTAASPNRAQCPLCRRGKVLFYRDPHLPVKRFFTDCCEKSGDILALIQQIRSVSTLGALSILESASPTDAKLYRECSQSGSHNQARQAAVSQMFSVATGFSIASGTQAITHLIDKLNLSFCSQLGWHRDSIDRLLLAINAQDFEREMRGDSTQKGSRRLTTLRFAPKELNHFAVQALHTAPGVVGSIYVLGVKNTKPIQRVIPVGLEGNQDAGLLIHPTTLIQDTSVILSSDLLRVTRASLIQSGQTPEPSRFVGISFDKENPTTSLQSLANREVVIWERELTPKMLRVAVRLSAKISSLGVSGKSELTSAVTRESETAVFNRIAQASVPWWEAVAKEIDRQGLDPVLDLVARSQIREPDIERIANCCSPEIANQLRKFSSDVFSLKTLWCDRHLLEQRPTGWYVVGHDWEEQIANKPWRVRRVLYRADRKPEYEVEIFEEQTWHSGICDKRELERRPFETISAVCENLQLNMFSFRPDWSSKALWIANQFQPPLDPVKQYPVGLDYQKGLFRTSRAVINLGTGEITSNKTGEVSESLLPHGSATLPDLSGVRALLRCRRSCQILSSIASQFTRFLIGQDPSLVITHGSATLAARQLLDQLELYDTPTGSPIRYLSLERQPTNRLAKRLVGLVEFGWQHGNPAIANWLALNRDVVFLDSRGPLGPLGSKAVLQTVLLHLIAKSIAFSRERHSVMSCVDAAWGKLLSELKLAKPVDLIAKEINASAACGYWVGEGLATRVLRAEKPQDHVLGFRSIYPVGFRKEFWFNRDVLNTVLANSELYPINYDKLLARMLHDPLFMGQRRRSRDTYWKLKTEVIPEIARSHLRLRAPGGGRKRKTG